MRGRDVNGRRMWRHHVGVRAQKARVFGFKQGLAGDVLVDFKRINRRCDWYIILTLDLTKTPYCSVKLKS